MKAALVGLSGSGKSTVFKALDFPFYEGKGGERIATLSMPDERLKSIAKIFSSKKITRVKAELIDIRNLGSIPDADVLGVVLDLFSGRDPAADAQELLTKLPAKPVFLIANFGDKTEIPAALRKFAEDKGLRLIGIPAKLEEEIMELEEAEREVFREEMGIEGDLQKRFLNLITEVSGIMSFYTAGDNESREWLLNKEVAAVQAAGKIHSDMERGFIRAETIAYNDLIECNSVNAVKAKGLFRLEGKEYIVKDGDIITFRFGV